MKMETINPSVRGFVGKEAFSYFCEIGMGLFQVWELVLHFLIEEASTQSHPHLECNKNQDAE